MLSDDSEAYERAKSFEMTLHDSTQMQASDECIEDPLKESTIIINTNGANMNLGSISRYRDYRYEYTIYRLKYSQLKRYDFVDIMGIPILVQKTTLTFFLIVFYNINAINGLVRCIESIKVSCRNRCYSLSNIQ